MQAKVLEVEVFTNKGGNISIKGPAPVGSYQEPIIAITAEQVDVLINWLKEAKEEILARTDAEREEFELEEGD